MFDKKVPYLVNEYSIVEATDENGFNKVARSLDFPAHVTYDPDYLYLWIRIVSSGEHYGPNKNGDYFPLSELVGAFETFRDAHPFKNHENKDIEKAIGRIFDVRYDDEMKTIEVFKAIDKKRSPEIVRGYLKGYLTDVSMGCKVPYTVCSICGNKAKRQSEFCDHVKSHKLEFLPTGERIFEINYAPKFHDSSVVLNGAERVAKAIMIIDEPPANATPSFKKVASEGVSRYIPLTNMEFEKVAAYREQLHPMLQEMTLEKVASSDVLQKLAELEKEVSGKIVNLLGDETLENDEKIVHMMKIIRFLTDERFDAESLTEIAETLKTLAREQNVPLSKVFTTFLGMAELFGITLYPTELHTLMQQSTGSKLYEPTDLSGTNVKEVYPSDVTKALAETQEATKLLPKFDDPGKLISFYDRAPFEVDAFAQSPSRFLAMMPETNDVEQDASRHVVDVIQKMLAPILPRRSALPEHLMPRIAVVVTGHRPLIGSPAVASDVAMLRTPRSMGDLMGAMAYRSYETIRPGLRITRIVKTASAHLDSIEKTAGVEDTYNAAKRKAAGLKDYTPKQFIGEKGLGRMKLLAVGLPAAYVASAFMKSKDSNGEPLTSGERFVAEHPGMISVGGALVGKPLTGLAAKGTNKALNLAGAGVTKARNGVQRVKNYAMKEASVGNYNAFDDAAIEKIAADWQAPVEVIRLLKVATIFEIGGLEKEACDLRAAYGMDDQLIDHFMERIASDVAEEMEKAANDYTDNFLIDSVADIKPLGTTIPGRVVDAFVFKKIMDLGQKFMNKSKEVAPNAMAGKTPTIQPPTV